MPPVAVQLSYRLGGADGVAVEARKWEWALHELGFRVRRVAGELDDGLRPDDAWLPFLAIDPVDGTRAATRRARGRDRRRRPRDRREPLLAADQPRRRRRSPPTCSPSTTGRVVFHHHDLPWQRAGLLDAAGHPAAPAELAARDDQRPLARAAREPRLRRGHAAQRVRPRSAARRPRRARAPTFGFAPDDLVLLQPTRAIPRKNIPGAIAFADRARARSSPTATSGSGSPVPRKTATTTCSRASSPSRRCRSPSDGPRRAADAYAAADLVLFPSTWEGFGNPVIESIAHRRPIAVGNYPVLDELRAFGVQLLSIDDADGVQAWLRAPDPEVLEAQRRAGAAALLARRPAPSASTTRSTRRRMELVVSPAQRSRSSQRRARIARWVGLAKRVGLRAAARSRSSLFVDRRGHRLPERASSP